MLQYDQIPEEVLERADKFDTARGRPRSMSETEKKIIGFLDAQYEDYLVPFCHLKIELELTTDHYKYALKRLQADNSLFAETLEENGVSFFKRGNRLFLWKRS